MNKFITFIFAMILISFASADVFTLNQEQDIRIICINDGFCSASSFCTINIADPDNILIVDNQNMTNQINYHNYTITLNKTGTYKTSGFCIDGEYSKEIDYTFDVNQNAASLSTGGSILYFLFAGGALLLFSFCLYWVFALPRTNNLTEAGEFVSINDWKYLRYFLIPVCYVLLWWIFGIMRSIFTNFLVLDGPHLFFNWGYWILAAGAFPLTIIGLWGLFVMIINDKRILDSLKKGRPIINGSRR